MQCAVWWSSRAGSHAQLLPVTQQAGGPRRRKLPGCTVALKAPPHNLSSLFLRLLKNPKATPRWFQTGGSRVWCFFVFFIGFPGCFQRLGGCSPRIRPRQLRRRRLQFTAELRCTSRGDADQVNRMKHSFTRCRVSFC